MGIGDECCLHLWVNPTCVGHVCKAAMYSDGMYTILPVMDMAPMDPPFLTRLNVIILLPQPEGGLPVVCLQPL